MKDPFNGSFSCVGGRIENREPGWSALNVELNFQLHATRTFSHIYARLHPNRSCQALGIVCSWRFWNLISVITVVAVGKRILSLPVVERSLERALFNDSSAGYTRICMPLKL